MDISTRLIKLNIIGAMVFSSYFYLQNCEMLFRVLSFFATVPIAKNVLDRLSVPVQAGNGCAYPVKRMFVNFLNHDYGVWSVLLIELIRRMAYRGVFSGMFSIVLMFAWLLGYVFTTSTGVCYTNVKDYRRGTFGFAVVSWLEIIVSLLMGSGWVF